MTATTPKPTSVLLSPYVPSDEPGGFLPSKELDRANAFASLRHALIEAMALPRDETSQDVLPASVGWVGARATHGIDVLEAGENTYDHLDFGTLEAYCLERLELFSWGESLALSLAPKHPALPSTIH